MKKAAIIFSILLLYGFQTISGDDGDTIEDLSYDITHTHIESDNPVDVYSAVFFKNADETLKIVKYSSPKDTFYLISLSYEGRRPRMMTGEVVVEIDGFKSEYRDGQPISSVAYDGTVSESVTIRLDNFLVNDMRLAATLQITYQYEPPLSVTSKGIEIIKQFINELDSNFNPFS